jgi:hypothetical protein
MDPLSISVSCITLITTISKASWTLTTFVREFKDAPADLAAIALEMQSIQVVLGNLARDTAGSSANTLAPSLQQQIVEIISNCNKLADDIVASLTAHSRSRLGKRGYWTLGGGKDTMAKHRSSLEAHKSALELAVQMVAISVARDIKSDTTQIGALESDTTRILREIERLRARLPRDVNQDERTNSLMQTLDDLSSYAGSVYGESDDEEDEEDQDNGYYSQDEGEQNNTKPALPSRKSRPTYNSEESEQSHGELALSPPMLRPAYKKIIFSKPWSGPRGSGVAYSNPDGGRFTAISGTVLTPYIRLSADTMHNSCAGIEPGKEFPTVMRYVTNDVLLLSLGRNKSQTANPTYIQFSSGWVSLQHCEIRYTNGTWSIRDTKSRFGTFLNGGHRLSPRDQRSPWHRLEDGDTLQLGKLRDGERLSKRDPETGLKLDISNFPGAGKVIKMTVEVGVTQIARDW